MSDGPAALAGYAVASLALLAVILVALRVAARLRLRRHLRDVDEKRARRLADSNVVEIKPRREKL